MNKALESLADKINETHGDSIVAAELLFDELTLIVKADNLLNICQSLRDSYGFDQLIDLLGVDFYSFGETEWNTEDASSTGFSRGLQAATSGRFKFGAVAKTESEADRFAVEYLLLSVMNNQRLRLRVYCPDSKAPMVDSVVGIWNSANWYEREAFDLFGILFSGHPDLRRILTDYGFIGHPFRKDFPQIGHVEMRYDPESKRVVYQPVTVEPRVLVPKVKRKTEPAVPTTGEKDA
jgi:NADH-quinone oxidoreductase subunit C